MKPQDFKQRISDIENPNKLDEIKQDLLHFIEETRRQRHQTIDFGHYSNELEEETTQLDEAQGQYHYRMKEFREDLKQMRDIVERKLEEM